MGTRAISSANGMGDRTTATAAEAIPVRCISALDGTVGSLSTGVPRRTVRKSRMVRRALVARWVPREMRMRLALLCDKSVANGRADFGQNEDRGGRSTETTEEERGGA